MSHFDFAKEIRKRIGNISKADKLTNWFYIFSDYGAICLSIFLVKENPLPLVYFLAVIVIGSRFRALENLIHEAAHGNLFLNPSVNRWGSIIGCGFLTLTSPHAFTESHNPHHKHLNDPEKDPDRIRSHKSGTDRFPIPRSELIVYILSIPTRVPKYFFESFKGFIYSPTIPMSEQITRLSLWLIAGVNIQFFGLWADFCYFWVIPFLTTFQIIRYLAELTEHNGLYDAQDDIEKTRNNFCHPVLRWFLYPHGDYYHLVHHLFCRVPHYNLGIAHRILLEDDNYREKGQHCYGFFLPTTPDRPSIFEKLTIESNTTDHQQAITKI